MLIRNDKGVTAEASDMCVLYDPKSGDIVHLHQQMTFPGGRKPSRDELEAQALQHAEKARGTGLKLKALHVPAQQYERSKCYKVHVKSQRLVELPLPKAVQDRLRKMGRTTVPKAK
jgi:hypothetical protein